MGRQDALLGEHSAHFDRINGSIRDLATAMAAQATTSAVQASSIANIERLLDTGSEATSRQKGISTQWWLAIFAAAIALMVFVMGTIVTIILAVVVLIANGKL